MANLNDVLQALVNLTSKISTKLASKADADHNHNDEYYTEGEIDSKVSTLNSSINSKADKTYVDNAVANIDIDGVVKTSDVVEGVVDIDATYVTHAELDDALSDFNDINLSTTQIKTTGGQVLQVSLEETWEWIEEVSNVAYTNQATIGGDNLATTNKTITGAINELFQRGNNVKQMLVDALIASGVEASTNETFESLTTKVQENSGGGGLDIITATVLPATGKENQICIISDDPNYDVLVTTNMNESLTDPSFIVYLGNSASSDASLGTLLPIANGNVIINYYFNKVSFGSNRLASYYYANNQWNELTKAKLVIYENFSFPNSDIFGNFAQGAFTYDSSTPIIRIYDGSYYAANSFSNKINFSLYNTIEILAKRDSYYDATTLIVASTSIALSNTKGSSIEDSANNSTINYLSKSIAYTASTSYKYDISSWTGEYYLTLIGGRAGQFEISAIYIY